MSAEPIREGVTTHQCVCTLVQQTGARDKCTMTVDNPDQPFCNDCEMERHDLLPEQVGLVEMMEGGGR